MSIAFESDEVQLENLRKRLRLMSDEELVRFGKAARSLCRDWVEAQAPAPFRACYIKLTCSPCMSHAPILYLETFSSGTHLILYNHFDHTPKAARVNNLAASLLWSVASAS
jgi:hypothetical protein